MRVRLLGDAGVQGLEKTGVRDRPGQLEPRDDHDRSRHGGRDLHRAAERGLPHGDHREGAPRRPAAEPGRADRPEPLLGAGRRGSPREVRGPGDRGQHRRDQAGRGPPGVQEHHGAARDRGAPQRHRHQLRGRRAGREGDRPPGGDPARLHHGRDGRRLRVQHGGVPDDRRPGALGQPGEPDPRGRVGPRLGGARAGGGAGRQGAEDHRLLHRERRRDGRAHRRFLLHRPDADDRAGAPGAPAEVFLRHRRRHRGDRRDEHPVRPRPEDRPDGRDRDQPAHLPLLRPRLQGDRLPHRLRLLPPRLRADARRDPVLEGRNAWRSTRLPATTSSSSSPAGPSRSSRGCRTGSARRCARSAR